MVLNVLYTRPYTKQEIHTTLRIRLYKTIIRPFVTCGAISWTLRNKMERASVTWDTKILRKMCGPMYVIVSKVVKMDSERT